MMQEPEPLRPPETGLEARLAETLSELRSTAEELSMRGIRESAALYEAKAEGFSLALGIVQHFRQEGGEF